MIQWNYSIQIDRNNLYDKSITHTLYFLLHVDFFGVKPGESSILSGVIYDVPHYLLNYYSYNELFPDYFPSPYSLAKFEISYTKQKNNHPCKDFKIKDIEYTKRGKDIIDNTFKNEKRLIECIQSFNMFQ